jgi:hypothetical protein
MNHSRCFVDTGHWLALANSNDHLHKRATTLAASLPGPFVTTEAVLLEVGDAMAGRKLRKLGAAVLADARTDPEVEVVPLSPELFDNALRLYSARPDKEWSLTDCVSFVVMKERCIEEALAADQHFTQAGFRALLLE